MRQNGREPETIRWAGAHTDPPSVARAAVNSMKRASPAVRCQKYPLDTRPASGSVRIIRVGGRRVKPSREQWAP
jgi:hypothetical protein